MTSRAAPILKARSSFSRSPTRRAPRGGQTPCTRAQRAAECSSAVVTPPIGHGGKTELVELMHFVIALAASFGTSIQLRLSLMDFGASRRDAVNWWNAEDELVAEATRLRRRSVRREIRSWRDEETSRTIRDLRLALISWAILVVASALATYAAFLDVLGS